MAHDAMEEELNNEPDLFGTRGLAIEAIQSMRSHEKVDEIRFGNVDQNMREIKASITDLTQEVKDGFKRNDNRFWSLGISFITLLLSSCGFLIWEIINKHV